MDFGFEGFETSGFETELEDFEVKKVRKFDRIWKIGSGGSVCAQPAIDSNRIYIAAMDNHVYCVDVIAKRKYGGSGQGSMVMQHALLCTTGFCITEQGTGFSMR